MLAYPDCSEIINKSWQGRGAIGYDEQGATGQRFEYTRPYVASIIPKDLRLRN